jgi:iron complex transport system substrate-binding protein
MAGGAVIRRFALLLLGIGLAAAEAKPRVASINMCTDQLVLALADDEQILGLSALSLDPALSYYHRRARRFPILSGTAEDVLTLGADLVVTATLARPQTRGLLVASGQRVETFADARSIAEVKAQITRMGALLDQPDRAAAAIARIDAAARGPAGASRTILPLERRGWITGRDTLLSDVLASLGHRNLGAEMVAYGGRLPLEAIVRMEPDRLLIHTSAERAEDQGTALLQHPALAGLKARGILSIPDSLLVCPGPMLAEAFDRLR